MKPAAYKQMYELEDTHWWFLAKRRYISELLPKPRSCWNILDIGAGTGGMTVYLQRWGHVKAVEISPHAISYLRKRKVSFIRQDITMFSAPKNFYDLVSLCDVLYHRNVSDDTAVLKKIYSCLKPGGLLYIADSALPLIYSHHDVVMKTRERYIVSELGKKVTSCGFAIQKKSYVFFFVFPIVLLVRLIGKYVSFETIGEVSRPVNALLLTMCKLESVFLKYLDYPIGSSLVILAKKPA